jgi:hypothetical protein
VRLGDDNTHDKSPVDVAGISKVKKLVSNQYSIYAIMEDGSVKAWGRNNFGQLGIGNTINQTKPVTISGLKNVKKIFFGENTPEAYAIMEDGSVKAWGRNSSGQLGIGTYGSNQLIPETITGLQDVKDLTESNGENVHVLIKDGSVKGWGDNSHGRLGIGNNEQQLSPVTIPNLTGVKKIYDTYAIMEDGSVKAWGNNSYGQLGIGNTKIQPLPVTIPNLNLAPLMLNPPILTPSSTEPTDQNVVVTITYPDTVVVKKYKIGNTDTWLDYTQPITITENTIIYAKGQNSSGQWSDESSLVISNINKSSSRFNLKAVGADGKVSLTWNSIDNATSYIISRSITLDGDYTVLSSDVNETSYNDLTVINDTTYYYKVNAVTPEGTSDDSNKVSATPSKKINKKTLIVITLVSGKEVVCDMVNSEGVKFLDWMEKAVNGQGHKVYTITELSNIDIPKKYNIGSVTNRRRNIIFEKIECFEVIEYTGQ